MKETIKVKAIWEFEVDTDDETQLIYAALMEYANKLYNIAKEVPNESEITNKLTDRAKQSWNLARKIIRQKG